MDRYAPRILNRSANRPTVGMNGQLCLGWKKSHTNPEGVVWLLQKDITT